MNKRDLVQLEMTPLGRGMGSAAVLRLNRPEQLNPLDWDTIKALDARLDQVVADKKVRAVLITGNGRAFSAGGDLKGYMKLYRDPEVFRGFLDDLHRTFYRLQLISVPAVALINGVTAAGGLELVLNCDFALIARSARIGDGHLNFGQMGGGGVLTLLPRIIGKSRAAELIYSGRLLSAADAVEWGLASRVVDDEVLLNAGLQFASEVAAKSPLAVANVKRVMNRLWSDNGSVDAGARFEAEADEFYCLTSHDAYEGLEAFAEKRKPKFKGR